MLADVNGTGLDEVANLNGAREKVGAEAHVIVTVAKPSKDAKLGLGIQKKGEDAIVTSVLPHGLFAGTELRAGMAIRFVNGRPCGTFDQCLEALKRAVETVTIAASSHPSTPTAAATKNATTFAAAAGPPSTAAVAVNRVADQKENSTNKHPRAPTGSVVRPATKKHKSSSVTHGDIESAVDKSPLANVREAIANVWDGGVSMRSDKPLEEFLNAYDCTSCCFTCKRRIKREYIEVLSGGELAICSRCANRNEKFTLTEVTDHFHIPKGDAKRMSHSLGISGWGGIKYSFSNRTVVDEIRYDEALQRKARKEAFFSRKYCAGITFSKVRFDRAGTREGKREVLNKIMSNIPEERLREFAAKSLKKVPKYEVGRCLAGL